MENFNEEKKNNKEVDILNELDEIFSKTALSDNNEIDGTQSAINFVNEVIGKVKTSNLNLKKLGELSGIEVFQSGTLCYRVGAGGGFISINPLTMRPYIVVDDNFNKLSNTSKAFVLLHEVGHYENGDFRVLRGNKLSNLKNKLEVTSEKIKLKVFKTYPNRETEADYYAMSHLNSLDDSLKALDEIIESLTADITEKIKYIKESDLENKEKILKSLNKALDFQFKSNNIRKTKLENKFYNGPYFIEKDHNTKLD